MDEEGLYIPHGSDESIVTLTYPSDFTLDFISHMVQMKERYADEIRVDVSDFISHMVQMKGNI